MATAGEKRILVAALEEQRRAVLWKLQDLDDERLRRPLVPSGTSLLGLAKHLASVEYGWLCRAFGREHDAVPAAAFEDDPRADWTVHPWETTEGVLAYYERARAAADASVAALKLTDRGTTADGTPVSLRWVLVHLVGETARHAGHADVLREQLDGRTGERPSP
ncbi:DinB family protein [Kineococcus gypseus]